MGNASTKTAKSTDAANRLGGFRKGRLVSGLLDAVQQTLVETASAAASKGELFYAAAILRKDDLSIVALGQDKTRTDDPTSTAELNAIRGFFGRSVETRPATTECIFLCVHEPSPMALCQIAVSGFDNFVYLFSREETKELGLESTPVALSLIFNGAIDGCTYKAENAYWTAFSLRGFIEMCEKSDKKQVYLEQVAAIKARFAEMGKTMPSPTAPQTPKS